MPGVHFRHRTTARHYDGNDNEAADGGNDYAPVVYDLDHIGVSGAQGVDVAKLQQQRRRRRRQRQQHPRLSCGSTLSGSQQPQSCLHFRHCIFAFVVISFTLVLFSISLRTGGKSFWRDSLSSITSNTTYNEKLGGETLKYNHDDDDDNKGCTFRSYPASRLYGLSFTASEQHQQQPPQPDFLVTATYIRGKWPIVLNPIHQDDRIRQTPPSKICINTTYWEQTTTTVTNKTETGISMPFTDGQNPSIVSLASQPYNDYITPHSGAGAASSLPLPRLNPRHLRPLLASISASTGQAPSFNLDNLFLGAIAFGSGQCRFGLVEHDKDKDKLKKVTDEEGPPGGKRAVIYVLAPPTSNNTDFGNSTHDTTVKNSKGGQQQDPHHPDSTMSSSSLYFRTLAQSTLLLERDGKYGTSRKRAISSLRLEDSSSYHARIQLEFDDPRLFFHHGRVWILYRNGPLFGYDAQIHNPLHFEQPRIIEHDKGGDNADGQQLFTAYVKASETVIIRGGRNIALISEEPIMSKRDGKVRWMPFPKLKALTWVDPVTVVQDIDLRGIDQRLLLMEVEEEGEEEEGHDNIDNNGGVEQRNGRRALSERRLRTTVTKSNIHGTNGYMIPLATTGELLGIAHFHRPEDRRPSQYALHGHHYTHAFFTIARDDAGTTTTTTTSSTTGVGNSTMKETTVQSYKLKRLSNEFIFRTNSIPEGMTQPPSDDGDIIQFASGLDLLGSDTDGRIVISYGINDCEGAVFTLSMKIVQQMLIMVRPGQEVVDLMKGIGS